MYFPIIEEFYFIYLTFQEQTCIQDFSKLKVDDMIDHQDTMGRFLYAKIIDMREIGSKFKIHYDGWSSKWDIWSDYENFPEKFAIAGSISKRPAHRFKELKVGDYVDINPLRTHPGWKPGKIRSLHKTSGQCHICYKHGDKLLYYWAHLDDAEQIAEFESKSTTLLD